MFKQESPGGVHSESEYSITMEAICNSQQQLNTIFFLEYLQLQKNSTPEIHLVVSIQA